MDITSSIWTHWHGHPDAIIGLLIIEFLYLVGIGPLRIKKTLSNQIDPKKTFMFTLLTAFIKPDVLTTLALNFTIF